MYVEADVNYERTNLYHISPINFFMHFIKIKMSACQMFFTWIFASYRVQSVSIAQFLTSFIYVKFGRKLKHRKYNNVYSIEWNLLNYCLSLLDLSGHRFLFAYKKNWNRLMCHSLLLLKFCDLLSEWINLEKNLCLCRDLNVYFFIKLEEIIFIRRQQECTDGAYFCLLLVTTRIHILRKGNVSVLSVHWGRGRGPYVTTAVPFKLNSLGNPFPSIPRSPNPYRDPRTCSNLVTSSLYIYWQAIGRLALDWKAFLFIKGRDIMLMISIPIFIIIYDN